MTTYIITTELFGELSAMPMCERHAPDLSLVDDRYEFDEFCRACGDVIPAALVPGDDDRQTRTVDPGYLYSDVGHGGPFSLIDLTPTPPLKL